MKVPTRMSPDGQNLLHLLLNLITDCHAYCAHIYVCDFHSAWSVSI